MACRAYCEHITTNSDISVQTQKQKPRPVNTKNENITLSQVFQAPASACIPHIPPYFICTLHISYLISAHTRAAQRGLAWTCRHGGLPFKALLLSTPRHDSKPTVSPRSKVKTGEDRGWAGDKHNYGFTEQGLMCRLCEKDGVTGSSQVGEHTSYRKKAVKPCLFCYLNIRLSPVGWVGWISFAHS